MRDTALKIEVQLDDEASDHELAELRRGLLAAPRQIPSRYFYDDLGSRLFEQICELDEYYQTRTERALLEQIAEPLIRDTGARELLEVGSGAATKTRVLLDAMQRAGTLERYLPLDVSESMLRRTAEELVREYRGLEVHGIVGNFMEHLDAVPKTAAEGPRLIVFLGGTLGNLRPVPEGVELLSALAASLGVEDSLLLGTDLIKDVERLEAAYNDSQGITARFNLNVLANLNRTFDASFDLDAFKHRAVYNRAEHRIEMWLDSQRRQHVSIGALDLDLLLEEGEGLRTEISTKFDRPKVESLLAKAGLELVDWYTDPEELFALSLSRLANGTP